MGFMQKALAGIKDFMGCEHEWGESLKPMEPTGYVTMGWDLKLTRVFRHFECCTKCGEERSTGGWVVRGDRKINPESYNSEGWPIDEEGNKLPLEER